MAESAEAQKGPFPLTEGKVRGYRVNEVDEFLDQIKATYEGGVAEGEKITASMIRRRGFAISKKGYDPRFVDAALDRLEEVLFDRERRAFQEKNGLEAWQKSIESLGSDLALRMRRDRSSRFTRRSIFSSGYRISQVDAVIDQLADRLDQGLDVRVNDVRTVRFYPQRRGYDEAQVDAFLDAVVEYLLSQR